MYRWTVSGALGAALLLAGLGTVSSGAEKKSAREHLMHAGPHEKCALACGICAGACDSCFRHCADLVAEGHKEHRRTMQLCVDCGEVCSTAAKLCLHHSSLTSPMCQACARACDECGEACAKHRDDQHMQMCARACRECAKACREMIEHSGHDHGPGEKKE